MSDMGGDSATGKWRYVLYLEGEDAEYCDAAVVQYVRDVVQSLGVQMLLTTTTSHACCVLDAL